MGLTLQIGNPPLDVAVRRSSRAKRLTLRLATGTGAAVATVPMRVDVADVLTFLNRQEEWIRSRQAALPKLVHPAPGDAMPLRGRMMSLLTSPDARVRIEGDTLLVPGQGEAFRRRLQGWLRKQARTLLLARAQSYADLLDVSFTKITLRDSRSRWGSCSSSGALNFSWRLVLAPPDVLDYVAAHEVAHLVEMNHSQRYWSVVERIFPDYRAQRDWLRKNGVDLHRYRFD